MDVSCRVCYATLVTEKALGKKLRKCTRCNTALYASREAQRSHWKLHKAVCRGGLQMGRSGVGSRFAIHGWQSL